MLSGWPFCDKDHIFDYTGVSNNTDLTIWSIPHISECYQHSLLIYIPSIFLFLFSPITLFALYKSDNGPLECCSFIFLKIFLGTLLFMNGTVLWAYSLFEYFTLDTGPDSLQIIGYTSLYFALAVALVLTVASRNRGLVTSGVLFNFWLLLAVCGFPEFWYKVNTFKSLDETEQSYSTFYFINYMIYYGLVLLELLFNCFADAPKYRVIDKKSCPELYSSFLNQITFQWFNQLAIKGYKRSLEQEDLWDLNSRDKSKHLMEKFTKVWDEHIESSDLGQTKNPTDLKSDKDIQIKYINGKQIYLKQAPSILYPLFKAFRWPFIGGALYKFIFDIFSFTAPQLLHLLIDFIEDKSQPQWVGILIAVVMFTIACVQSLILHQYFHNMFRLGMNIRSVLTSMVYKKALYLSNKARKKQTVGQIVNLMSIDVQRVQDLTTFVMLFWSAPLQIFLSIYFLSKLLGTAVIGGLLILVLMTPLNWVIAAKMRKCQMQQMKYKDERLKMTNEALNGIKVLKLNAWEASMKKVILDIRKKEIVVLKKLAYLNAATALSWSCAPFLVAVVTFGIYVIRDPTNNVLTPQVTFVALSLFNILRFPLAILAMIWGQAIQCQVSNKRLKDFLASDEIEHIPPPEAIKSDVAIAVRDGEFVWSEDDQFKLDGINITIKKGSLVAIVGRIGSGKTSLMSALLGEMQCLNGGVAVSGSVAYVPQQPWIQNMSVKKNILFNQNYHQLLYERVIEAAALNTDLKALPAGDETEIGEKGINLSGGQKQRVSLARSVYSQTDIYLFDDPLSAVDAHVGKHIFENIISSQTGMLKYHTRVLVTHGLNYLKHCDQIIVMKDGKVSESGSYQDLISDSGEFSEILEEFLIEEAKNRGRSVSFGEDADEVRKVLADLERLHPVKTQQIQRQISQNVDRLSPGPLDVDNRRIDNGKKLHIDDPDKVPLLPTSNGTTAAKAPEVNRAKLVEKEGVETGQVKLNVYSTYIRAIGIPVTILFVTIYTFSSILGVYSNLYLADWSDHASEIQRTDEGSYNSTIRLAVYTALGLGQASSVCVASILMALGMVFASRLLHERMLTNILRSPMAFFDVTPLGRILNRFSKDVDGLDAAIPRSLMAFVRTAIASFEIIAVIAFATPWFMPCFGILALLYFFVLRFYISTSRQLKRLESTTRSPIYSHFQESIQGATSIRAYRSTDHFLLESQKRVDANLLSYYPSIVANRWLAVRLELVGSCIVLFAALLAVMFRERDSVTPGLVGLSVSYAFNITQTLNWAVRMTSELETNVVAVERIKEYSETPTEGDLETAPGCKLPNDWPSRGSLNIEDLEVKYRPELDLVLKGINVHIGSTEKVGVVGRTGAGKSSLMMALFRLVEPHYGKIFIDGVDISTLGLNDLRSRLTIVPQDPVLFSGTLRTNLDPFGHHSDEEIWEALTLTSMDKFVLSLNGVLEYAITEGGENLSVGQRQLICLARALLRKSKLLVLDEAAASVDMETDQLIQKTIQEQFADCTVLTIAHRLHSVKNSDRLMVLDSGNVAEFESPDVLLNNPSSLFYSMAMDAGLINH